MTILTLHCANCNTYTRHYLVQPATTFYETEVYKCVECGKKSYVNHNVTAANNPVRVVQVPLNKKDATQ